MPFFPITPAEKWSTYGTMIGLLLLWIVWRPRFYPVQLMRFDSKSDYDLKLVEWERDRVLSLAKGVAATSVTYLAALVPVILKKGFSNHIPPFVIVGVAAGFLGGLFLSANMAMMTTQFTRFPGRFVSPPPSSLPKTRLPYDDELGPPHWPYDDYYEED